MPAQTTCPTNPPNISHRPELPTALRSGTEQPKEGTLRPPHIVREVVRVTRSPDIPPPRYAPDTPASGASQPCPPDRGNQAFHPSEAAVRQSAKTPGTRSRGGNAPKPIRPYKQPQTSTRHASFNRVSPSNRAFSAIIPSFLTKKSGSAHQRKSTFAAEFYIG